MKAGSAAVLSFRPSAARAGTQYSLSPVLPFARQIDRCVLGPRFRGDDNGESFEQDFDKTRPTGETIQ
jgi:hypothetical protein